MKKMSKILLSIILIIPMLIKAEEVNTTYQGEYSLDYLLRNYNVVTFEQNDNPTYDFMKEYKVEKGIVNFNIEGPVLINGDYYDDYFKDEGLKFAMKNPTNSISHISGTKKDYVSTDSKISTNNSFIDYEKLYKQVLSESQALVDKTQYHINSKDIHISKPGIYQLNSVRMDITERYKSTYYRESYIEDQYFWDRNGTPIKIIYIDNYDPNKYYIFNNLKEYEYDSYIFMIKSESEDTFQALDDSVQYTGNIIFNYPNAKQIMIINKSGGKIIAPKADIILFYSKLVWYENKNMECLIDSIFSNSITSVKTSSSPSSDENFSGYNYISNINYLQYNSVSISFEKEELKEFEEIKNYEDDIYSGSYAIDEMLQNYSIVTLGQKEYETNTKFYKDNSDYKGNASLFHIAGQFLINGVIDSYRMDLESNRVNESHVNRPGTTWTGEDESKGSSLFYPDNYNGYGLYRFKRWGDGDSITGTNSIVYFKRDSAKINFRAIYTKENYINFNRLYNKIVEEQKEIKQGILVTPVDGVAHIEVGENYYIEDINQINEIVFDNFRANSEKMTVITVLNKDYINFPKISQSNAGSYVPTKDYFGKSEPMFEYEYYNFPDDIYAGNIIWNVPDSKYISFETGTPIIGHLVAPNADVEMKETHFAGGFIVNSLYAEGNSEAHFYPLQPVDIPENYDCFVANTNYFNGKWYTDETVLVVNPTAKDVLEPPKEPEQPKEEISNPKTGQVYTITFVLLLITLTSIISLIYIKKKKIIIN